MDVFEFGVLVAVAALAAIALLLLLCCFCFNAAAGDDVYTPAQQSPCI